MIAALWLRVQSLFVASGPRAARAGERDPLGPEGERFAAKVLKRKGFKILGRNLRVPMGEADILCRAPDGECIVLVEVKSRRIRAGEVAPPPEWSVHAFKRAKLTAILRHLARANGWTHLPLRVDVVAVEWPQTGEPIIRHHESVLVVQMTE